MMKRRPASAPFSLLTAGVGKRLALAASAAMALWLAIYWAMN